MIKNFGFMWEPNQVNWGSRGKGNSAKLLGQRKGNLDQHIDFAEQKGIYVLYDKFENPVQIGQTQRLLKRLREHKNDHLRNRWTYFSWFGLHVVNEGEGELSLVARKDMARMVSFSESLNQLEGILIQVLEPRLNRRGPNWKQVKEYLQVLLVKPIQDRDDEISDSE
jgi:hypothetical protein